ncbi:MAG: PIN domain-containing protein [Akkermansiaceae bacterium]|nr:PIN domain-containing protein [Akkermansiaceae bacterium]
MRTYWDSSALVAATIEGEIRDRLDTTDAFTRTHALAEVFSTLTGSRLGFRVDADDAALVVRDLLGAVEVVEISPPEVMEALDEARSRGVRSGQVHDYLHAVAARKAKCDTLLTLNISDFEGLFDELVLEEP